MRIIIHQRSEKKHVVFIDDKYCMLFICAYLILQSVNNLLYSAGLNGTMWNYFSKGLLAVLSLRAWITILKRNSLAAIMVESFAGLLLLYSYFYADTQQIFNSIAFNLLLVYIPMGLAYYSITDTSLITEYLYITAWLIELICLANAVFFPSNTYSMSIGYVLLLPLLIRLDRIFASVKWYDMVLSVVDLIIIIIVASRGPLICISFFVLVRVLFSNALSIKRRLAYVFLLTVFAIIVYSNYFSIVNALFLALERRGIQSRTIRLLLSGQIGYDAGRISIQNHYLNMIRQSPFIGHGIAGSWDYSSYPHNIAIELFLAFGIPLGAIALFGIIIITVKGLFQKNASERRIAQIFVSDLISLIWSGSFVMSPLFFVGLASCLKRKTN